MAAFLVGTPIMAKAAAKPTARVNTTVKAAASSEYVHRRFAFSPRPSLTFFFIKRRVVFSSILNGRCVFHDTPFLGSGRSGHRERSRARPALRLADDAHREERCRMLVDDVLG